VTQRDKSKIKHFVRRDATYAYAHPVSRIPIQARLRPINFVADDDWPSRRCV
jgi:hypothetical protein